MRFHVDFDLGNEIRFWIVPDNPQAVPSVYLFIDHIFKGAIPSNDERPVLRDWGWHATGHVAFRLNDDDVPGIAGASYIEIYDVDTLLLIYRRTSVAEQSNTKLFRYATGLTPDPTIDRAVFDAFRINYSHLETVPEETLQYIFDYHYTSSIYYSGRMQARRIRRLLDKNKIQTAVVLDDPYRLLARQILWLRSAAQIAQDDARRWRIAPFEEAISVASDLALDNPRQLRRQFSQLDGEAFLLLSNPVVRQFGADGESVPLSPEHYVAALDEISRIAVIGHTSHFPAFAPSLSACIGIDIGYVEPPVPSTAEDQLADVLRQVPSARTLIEFDIELVDHVENAVAEQWSPRP